MTSQGIAASIFFLSVFGTISFVVWLVVSAWQRRMRMKVTTEFNTKLLDRIGSIKDFNDFLQTDGGARFMDSLTVERSAARPVDGIVRANQAGTVLTTLGVGLLGLRWHFIARYPEAGDFEVLTIIGAVALSLGVGFFLSGILSYRLSKKLGLLEGQNRVESRTAMKQPRELGDARE